MDKKVFWNYHNDTIEIFIGEQPIYSIDLDRCQNSAEMLDWIFQIHNKAWSTPEILSQVLDAFNEATQQRLGVPAQSAFCPDGCFITHVPWTRTTRATA